jgi:hypothetical protein
LRHPLTIGTTIPTADELTRLGVAIFYGGLIAGILDPADNVTAYYFAAGYLNFVIHPAALTFSSYIFLTKRAGFAPGLLPTI